MLDAVGSTRAALIGTGQGSPAAIRLAHAYPERFDALVLVNPFARAMVDVDYEIGLSEEAFAQHSSGVIPAQAVGSDIDLLAPSLAGDPEVRRWWVRESRRGATPANAAAIWTYVRGVDVRSEARALRLPTLVVRCLQNGFVPAPFGGWLVDNVPGARAFDLPVADYVLWAIPWEHPLAEIEEFLTGSRDRSAGQHFFAAVMFTDIVDSTARNAAEGNRAWLDRLSRHDALIRQQIRRFGGNEIKGMGDGVLATFPAPSMALRCADAVASGAAEIGIAIRASVHAAEIEQRDNDVFGLGVTIAARALAYAGPGEVVTSATVVGLLTGSEFQFELRGIHELKGVPGEWPLYVLTALHAKG